MENSETGGVLPRVEPGRLYTGMDDGATRLRRAADGLIDVFGDGGKAQPRFFSAPGRTELAGNHTDHQRGRVIAAAVALDDIAAAVPVRENILRVYSEDYGLAAVDLSDLSPRPGDAGTPAALIRGIADYLTQQGYKAAGGLNAFVSGGVPVGSGLSSSAAFEVLIAAVLNGLCFDGGLPPGLLAQAGQYAENVHYGKPCGLMDQMASAVGGIITIDFEKPDKPGVERLPVDFDGFGYALMIIDTGAKHDKLSGEYAAIPVEMTEVARLMNADRLRDIEPKRFYDALPALRHRVSDRALLRAAHFFGENERVLRASEALKGGDFEGYLSAVRESGLSSWRLLQNIYPGGSVLDQSAALALMRCETLLGGCGACRIHGGGFGGTIQAYVPAGDAERFKVQMERVTGAGSCRVLPIRQAGAVEIVM